MTQKTACGAATRVRHSGIKFDNILVLKADLLRDRVCLSEIRVELCGDANCRNGGNDLLARHIANILNNLKGWRKCPKKAKVPGCGARWVYQRRGTKGIGHTVKDQNRRLNADDTEDMEEKAEYEVEKRPPVVDTLGAVSVPGCLD